MTPTVRSLAAAALVLAAALPARAVELEVLHYWVSPSEAAAVAVLRDAFEARGGRWLDRPVADNKSARQVMVSRGVDGIPPDVMHWIGSIDDIKQLVDLGIARPLPDQSFVSSGLLPPTVIPRTMRDGVGYLAPLSIHAENWLWYNVAVFARLGLEPPRTWEDLVAVSARLDAAGVTPIVSNPGGWEIQVIVRSVMSDAFLDPEYRSLSKTEWRAAARHPAFLRALDRLAALKPFIRPPTVAGNWDRSTADLMDGHAAMQFMGDWVKGEFYRRNLRPGEDIGCVRLPGPDKLILVGVDGFLLGSDSDPEVLAAQELFASVVMDPEVQLAFSVVKGSVPARTDIALERLDPCARLVSEALREDRVPFEGPRFPDHFRLAGPRLFATVTDFLSDPAISEADFRAQIEAVITDSTID